MRNFYWWLRNTVALKRAGYTFSQIRGVRLKGQELLLAKAAKRQQDEDYDWDNPDNYGERPW